jgi:UDP-galactopyranose mutase
LAGWDVALLPFAINESTRFISPTKTPEYLAGGKQVVSTPILDVIRPYGEKGLVWIAETQEEFVRGIDAALEAGEQSSEWMKRVDKHLAQNSWEGTWRKVCRLMVDTLKTSSGMTRTALSNASPTFPVIPTQSRVS